MPSIRFERPAFELEFPDGWRHRPARLFGCGTVGAVGLGAVCVILRELDRRLQLDLTPSGLGTVGAVLLALGGLGPTLYVLRWLRTPERRSSLPRLAGDLSRAGTLFLGPEGQWMHLTADPLHDYERPMDRWEMEEAFQRRYGERLIDQGWIAGAAGPMHWGRYRLGDRPQKKYTLYVRTSEDRQVEVVLTARLGGPIPRSAENAYDAIACSVRPA